MAIRVDQLSGSSFDWDNQYVRAAEAYIDSRLGHEYDGNSLKIHFHELSMAAGRHYYPNDHVIGELVRLYSSWNVSVARDQWLLFSQIQLKRGKCKK